MDKNFIAEILSKEFWRNVEIIGHALEIGDGPSYGETVAKNIEIKDTLEILGLELCEK